MVGAAYYAGQTAAGAIGAAVSAFNTYRSVSKLGRSFNSRSTRPSAMRSTSRESGMTMRYRRRRYRGSSRRSGYRNLFWTRDASSVTIPATTAGSLISLDTVLNTALGRTVNNWTLERLILDLQYTVPAGTTAGRSYGAFLGLGLIDGDAAVAAAYPEPFGDNVPWAWLDAPRLFADHTVPASYSSPAVPHSASHVHVDIRRRVRMRQAGQTLRIVGYHDNGLAANPTLYFSYSALWNVR